MEPPLLPHMSVAELGNGLVKTSQSDLEGKEKLSVLSLFDAELKAETGESAQGHDPRDKSCDQATDKTNSSVNMTEIIEPQFDLENSLSQNIFSVAGQNLFETTCNNQNPDSLPVSLIRLLPEISENCSVQSNSKDIDQDISSASEKKKPHPCDVCNKNFSQKYLLKIHYRTHTGDKPYKCTVCDRGFSQYSGLRTHNMIHTGERPYKCNICDKGFTQSSTLTIHYRKHTGNKPFHCDICGRAFAYTCAMKKHRTIHTGEKPYICDTCGKHFSRSGNLKAHSRIHSGDAPYDCPTCGKKFTQRSNMYTHLKTHSDIKNYACQMCGREFHTKFNLQRHLILTHAPEKTK